MRVPPTGGRVEALSPLERSHGETFSVKDLCLIRRGWDSVGLARTGGTIGRIEKELRTFGLSTLRPLPEPVSCGNIGSQARSDQLMAGVLWF